MSQNMKPMTLGKMRDILLEVAATANAALYASYATEADTRSGYEDALADIGKQVGNDTYFTPPEALAVATGALPRLPAPEAGEPLHVNTSVRLPELWAAKTEGCLNGRGERRVYGAFVRTEADFKEYFEIYRDSQLVVNGFFNNLGHSGCIKLTSRMLNKLVSISEHSIRLRKNRKLRAAEAGEVHEKEGRAE